MLRQKRVRINTSTSFFTERSKAPTMTFRPEEEDRCGEKPPLRRRLEADTGGSSHGLRSYLIAGWNWKRAWPRILMP